MAKIDVSVETGDQPAPPPDHPNTCPSCHSHYRDDELEQSLWVCEQCGHHFPMRARARIASLTDPDSFAEEAAELHSEDPLDFFDLRPYTERLAEAEMKTGLADAMVIGRAAMEGRPCELAVMDFAFMGGSMGSVVGEKFSRACDSAAEAGMPVVAVTSSGGARMQEGILALMQLPKTVAAVEDLHDSGQALLCVMAHPTTGGVLASFATLGDVAARRAGRAHVVRRARASCRRSRARSCPTTSAGPSRTSATATIDAIVPRSELRPTLARLLRLFEWRRLSTSCGCVSGSAAAEPAAARRRAPLRRARAAPAAARPDRRGGHGDEEIWRSVELARHQDRPYTLDYVERLLDDWFELHGDRARGDDGAMIAGLGKLDGRTVVLVGQQKGRDIHERDEPAASGCRTRRATAKAMRAMELADRHGFPVVTLVDTPGAYPGVAAEQHGQGGAIAHSQAVMARLKRADRRLCDRRGRLGRGDRDRARRPRADAGERDLLGHLAGGLRGDPLARRRPGEEGGGRLQARRRALSRARRDRRDRPGAAGGAHIDPDLAARLLGQALRESLGGARGAFRARISAAAAVPASCARRLRLRQLRGDLHRFLRCRDGHCPHRPQAYPRHVWVV